MLIPIEWLKQYVKLPAGTTTKEIADRLTAFDLKVEQIITSGVTGPLVVGKVLTRESETHSNNKTINWCTVDVGEAEPRGIVCGAHNFEPGDHVVVALPGAELPGGFQIAARKTYGHVSDGMICSQRELGLGDDHDGIIVLAEKPEVGTDAIELLGLDTEVLDIEVNPDRAYALSIRGVARDTALAFGVDFIDPAEVDTSFTGAAYPVVVDDFTGCPVFVAREVSGFDPAAPTPPHIARRIEQAGMRSLGLAIDITNYVMLELGQPLHGYDRDKLQGAIRVRRASAGEKIVTLDDVERTLTGDDLLITDDSGPIGLAGVMGGQTTELSETTTNIVIEAAHFDAAMIARGARRHKLPSEASRRFERGVDPELTLSASALAVKLLVEFGGGKIEPGMTITGEIPAQPEIKLAVDLPTRVTGIEIGAKEVVSALERNGCAVNESAGQLTVTPPSWRLDINDPYDVVEEVLRVVGYDKVPSVLPQAPVGKGRSKTQSLRRRISIVLAGRGLNEVKTFPFIGAEDFDRLGIQIDDARRNIVELENPLSAERPGMATTLVPAILNTVALNIGRGHRNIAVFELGRVFLDCRNGAKAPILGVDRRPTDEEFAALDAALPAQPEYVTLAITGEVNRSGWWGSGRLADWTDAVAAISDIARNLNVPIELRAAQYAPWHPGRCAEILVNGEVIGRVGELHPKVAANYSITERLALAECDVSALIAAAPQQGQVRQFSTFPVAKEDLAFVVDESVRAADLVAALSSASELVESVRLFDVYRGAQLPEGKKSLAFSLRLRAPDRTLSEAELGEARTLAISAVTALGGTIRE